MTYRIPLLFVCSALTFGLVEPASAFSFRDLFSSKKESQDLPQTQAIPDKAQQQKQAEFLARLRKSDPGYRSILKAVFNGQNELGLILNRSVPMDSIPTLSKTMLEQLAKDFPGQDLTVISYAPTNPPMKVGTARLDAKSGEMTYTPAR